RRRLSLPDSLPISCCAPWAKKITPSTTLTTVIAQDDDVATRQSMPGLLVRAAAAPGPAPLSSSQLNGAGPGAAAARTRRPGMDCLVATSSSWAITVVSVVLGVIFFAHGAQQEIGRESGRESLR